MTASRPPEQSGRPQQTPNTAADPTKQSTPSNRPSQPAGYDPLPGNAYPYGYEPLPVVRTTYQPTVEQLARDEARQHYFRRNVILPVVIAAIIVVLLIAVLLYLAFGVGTPAALSFIAGMSALVVILMVIPMIILLAILPISYIAFKANQRQQRKLYPEYGPTAYRSRIQIVLWRLESLLGDLYPQIERASDALTRPLIRAHALGARLMGFGEGLTTKPTFRTERSYNNDNYE